MMVLWSFDLLYRFSLYMKKILLSKSATVKLFCSSFYPYSTLSLLIENTSSLKRGRIVICIKWGPVDDRLIISLLDMYMLNQL